MKRICVWVGDVIEENLWRRAGELSTGATPTFSSAAREALAVNDMWLKTQKDIHSSIPGSSINFEEVMHLARSWVAAGKPPVDKLWKTYDLQGVDHTRSYVDHTSSPIYSETTHAIESESASIPAVSNIGTQEIIQDHTSAGPYIVKLRTDPSSLLPNSRTLSNKNVDREREQRAREHTPTATTPGHANVGSVISLWNQRATRAGSQLVPSGSVKGKRKDSLQAALYEVPHQVTWERAIDNLIRYLETENHGIRDARLTRFHRMFAKNPGGDFWVVALASGDYDTWIKTQAEEPGKGSKCGVKPAAKQAVEAVALETPKVLQFPAAPKSAPKETVVAQSPPPAQEPVQDDDSDEQGVSV